jgi:hypothetical protein
MKKPRRTSAVCLLFLLGGCEHSAPVTAAHVPPPAPASASLSPEARARLRESIDLEAMDRLLNTLGAKDGAQFLKSFEGAESVALGRADMETRGVSVTIWYADPERQQLLEHVWAPFWAQLPPSVLLDLSYPLPGRMLAAARRADSAAVARREREP